jgi:hypothetical protein
MAILIMPIILGVLRDPYNRGRCANLGIPSAYTISMTTSANAIEQAFEMGMEYPHISTYLEIPVEEQVKLAPLITEEFPRSSLELAWKKGNYYSTKLEG